MNFLRRGDFKLFSDFVSVTAELCKLSREETWTLPNAKLNITYRLQSNWNTRKENWYKLKEMYRRRKHKYQLQVSL